MGQASTRLVVRQIELLFDGGSAAGLSDRQLLERFTARRDSTAEAAFAALVARHGPMVMRVCRDLVRDVHLGEDAFQAVFLVLACKAKSIRDPGLLGNWLFGVAVRTALRTRSRLIRQRNKEGGAVMRYSSTGSNGPVEPMVDATRQSTLGSDELAAIHEEISRLPKAFRLPVVLCYFEGLTLDEAARTLCWPPGTVRSRLARGRDKLRRALSRRGFALSTTAVTVGFTSRDASAQFSSALCETTARAAIEFAAGQAGGQLVSASVAAVAREVLSSMFTRRVMLLVVALAFLGAAGAAYAMRSPTLQQEPKSARAKPEPRLAAKPENTQQQPVSGRMFIVGRVLDPEGKPVAGATVMAYARIPLPGHADGRRTIDPVSIGHAQSDGAGKFRLDAARTSSSRNDDFGVVAFAPGFGAGWVALDADAEQPSADISVRREQLIDVRLFDLQGRPAQGVTVSVRAIRKILERNPVASLERLEGPAFWTNYASDLPGWPKPMITDAEGRFSLRGIGREVRVSLAVSDPRFAQQDILIETDDPGDAKQFTMALQPPRIISGRVTYADTGKPVPHASIFVGAEAAGQRLLRSTRLQADDEGRFRANPSPGDRFRVGATPPAGQPYMSVNKTFDWPKGAVEHPVDLVLSRGMLIHGKVTERGSIKPVAGARLHFNSKSIQGTGSSNLSTLAETAADGSYQLVAEPRAGYLAVRGPGDDYVFASIGAELLYNDKPGGVPIYSNAFVRCEPKGDQSDIEVSVELRRGETVTGMLIAPDGQPAQETWMISRVIHGPQREIQRGWGGEAHAVVRNGRFELHGLDQDAEVPVYFLDAQRKLGATVSFAGRMASSGKVNVRLEPCGSAWLRLVDPHGKPLARFTPARMVLMVVTPGAVGVGLGQKEYPLLADQATMSQIDRINYAKPPTTDAEGRITLPALIPGATYRIADRTTAGTAEGPKLRKEFRVKSGEALDLGDILIEKPVMRR